MDWWRRLRWYRRTDMPSSRMTLLRESNNRMASHLMAATLIVILKEHTIRGRKIKTGWSHSTQRQLHQVLAQSQALLPQHRAHGSQPNLPIPGPIPPMGGPAPFLYQPGMLYPQMYMPPMHPYPAVPPPNGVIPPNGAAPPSGAGSSTPRTTSGNTTPATYEQKPKETPSPR